MFCKLQSQVRMKGWLCLFHSKVCPQLYHREANQWSGSIVCQLHGSVQHPSSQVPRTLVFLGKSNEKQCLLITDLWGKRHKYHQNKPGNQAGIIQSVVTHCSFEKNTMETSYLKLWFLICYQCREFVSEQKFLIGNLMLL